jgi:RNA polymerase sigma factor (sigma-70 family)
LRQLNVTNVEKEDQIKQIIDGCLRQDRRAQEQLFKLYYGKMLPVCMRYLSDRDTAQEALQEGFIKVFDKLGAYDHKGSFEGWVRRIMANTAIDYLRKAKKNPLLSDNDNDFKSGFHDPLEEMEELEFHEIKAEMAMEAIQELSPAYRAVFSMYVLEEFSHKEIAERLGISEGTSKSNLAKAKMNLQRILNERLTKVTAI